MRLFNKTIDRQLFKQYALGSDLSKQEVVAKIFNPMGAGTWFILNSDPNDPDYLWAIVDLGYGAEVGSVSRSDLETYRGRFGMGFERDLSFDPVNALELYNGLSEGKYYAKGGAVDKQSIEEEIRSLNSRIKSLSEINTKEASEQVKELVNSRGALQARLLHIEDSYADGGSIKEPKNEKEFLSSLELSVLNVKEKYLELKRDVDALKKKANLLQGSYNAFWDSGIGIKEDKNKYDLAYSLYLKFDNAYYIISRNDFESDINKSIELISKISGKFADGGELVDYSDNQLMVMNQNVEVEHHHEELEDILKEKTPVPAWVVAKMETATQNLSDITHYLDGEKELVEDENEDENEEEDEDQDEIENKIVVEPIDVSAGTKTDLTKNFTDEAMGNLRGFLKGMEGVDLRDDYTFDYKDEQYEVEPIINSDENGVSNAVFNIFDGDGEEVGDISYSREGGKQKFTANSEFFSWNNAKFEDGGFMNGVYADGGNIAIDNLNKNTDLREKMIDYIVGNKAYGKRMSDRQYDALEKRISDKSFVQLKKEYDTLKGNSSFADGGYFDGTIPKVSSYMSTYAKGGSMNKHFWSWKYAPNDNSFKSVIIYKTDIDDENSYNSVEQIKEQLTKEGVNKFIEEDLKHFWSWKYAPNDNSFKSVIIYKTDIDDENSYDSVKQIKEQLVKEGVNKFIEEDEENYAKGGEVAKAEIIGLSKNIMGTTSIEMKISGMRKSQDFSVYPIAKDDTDKIITIQSETRIGKIDLATGRGLMSQSHSNGAYFVHFQMDKLTPFTINEKDLKDITSHIFRTAGDNVGSRGIFSDNSGASGVYAKGGKIDNKDLEKLNAYWQSFYKGVMAGKKDEGYITITNKDELNKYITSKLGNVVKNIELIEKGKNYPYNDSYPYYEDIYSVELKNGTTFKIVRSYGRPRWQGNVDYKEQIIVENIKQYADGGNVEKPLTRFRVGESFRYKNNGSIIYTVTKVYNDGACEARDEEGDNYSFEFDELNELVKAENNYADGGGISLTKDFTILKDDFQKRENEPNRVYHSIEGLYKDNWFTAKTDNSFFKRYGSDGINKGGVYQLDVWKGGNPVGRDKSTTGGHVSEDHIAIYWNKWDYRSMKKADKQIVSEIVNLIDEKVTNTKRKLSSIKFADGGFMNNVYADGGQVRTFDTIFGKEIIFKEEQVGKFTIGISSGFNNRRHVFIYEGEIGKYGVKGLPKDFTQSPQLSVEFANNFYSNLKRKVQYNQDLRPFELIKDVKFLFAEGGFMNDVYAKGGDFDYQFYEVSASTKNGYDLYKINGIEEQDVFVDNYKTIKEANEAGQKLGLEKRPMWLRYGKGGKMSNFDKLSAKVAKNYEGKPVQGKYQEEYGKVYSKAEAKEVGDKVAGKVKAMQPAKKEMGGETKKGRGGSEILKQANILAKKIRKDGESWNDAKKRAFAQLKK